MKKKFLNLIHSFEVLIALTSFNICLGNIDLLFTSERVVTICTVQDSNGYSSIQASVGEIVNGVISDPGSWIITNLSENIGLSKIGNASACTSPDGDIIIAWRYLNTNYAGNIATAILFHDSAVWSINNITNYNEFDTGTDPSLACNSDGEVLLVWSAYEIATEQRVVYGAMNTLAARMGWGQPFVIIP